MPSVTSKAPSFSCVSCCSRNARSSPAASSLPRSIRISPIRLRAGASKGDVPSLWLTGNSSMRPDAGAMRWTLWHQFGSTRPGPYNDREFRPPATCRVRRPPHRLLSSSIPSDPGERRVVGRRVHRVDQRAPRAPEFRRALSATRAVGSRLLRSSRWGNPRGAGAPRPSLRNPRLLLLLLLVQRPPAAAASTRGSRTKRAARFSVLCLLGQRELDSTLGRRQRRVAGRSSLLAREREAPDLGPAAAVSRSAL